MDLESFIKEKKNLEPELPYMPLSPEDQLIVDERKYLAQKHGIWIEEEQIAILPCAHFLPYAAPQTITFYPVETVEEAYQTLLPYRPWLNILGSDELQYPYTELVPNIDLLKLQALFQHSTTIAQMYNPKLEWWIEDESQ